MSSFRQTLLRVAGVLALVWLVSQCGTAPGSPAASQRPAADPPSAQVSTPGAGPDGDSSAMPTAKPTKPTRHTSVGAGTAAAVLATLAVKGRAPMTGYARERFGAAWLDANRNGCDTRNDILDRDLRDKTFKSDTSGCVVLSGVLPDPYTGTAIAFERGGGDEVDIDHVVAMGNAWVTGAARWDIHKRAALANDPLGLLAVDMHSNRQKGDGDAATWLPHNQGFRCAYVARQITVKKKYGLWVTPPEKVAMQRILAACPDQRLIPDSSRAATTVDQPITDPGAAPMTAAPAGGGPRGQAGGNVRYQNCTAVRAAGAAPIHVGDPGYSRKLDRDGDGVGCE